MLKDVKDILLPMVLKLDDKSDIPLSVRNMFWANILYKYNNYILCIYDIIPDNLIPLYMSF